MGEERLSRIRNIGVVSALAAVADGALLTTYVLLVPPDTARQAFLVGYLVMLIALCLATSIAARHTAVSDDLRRAAAAGNVGFGLLALASIGAPFLLVGIALLLLPRSATPPSVRTSAVVVAMLVVLAGGVALT